MMFGLLLASFETISSTLTLAIKLINDHPKVIQELAVSDTKSSTIFLNYVFGCFFDFGFVVVGGGGGVVVVDNGDNCDER